MIFIQWSTRKKVVCLMPCTFLMSIACYSSSKMKIAHSKYRMQLMTQDVSIIEFSWKYFVCLPWTFFSSKKPNDCHDSRAIMCNLMPAVARLKCCRCRQTDSNTSWRSNGMNCRLWSLRMRIHRSVVLQIWTNNFDFHWISGQQSLLTLSLVSLSDKATLLSWIDFFLNNKNYYIDKRREYSPSRTEYTRRFVTRQYNCSTTSNCQVITQGGLPHNDTEPDEWWAQASQNTLGLLCSLRA
jgi:hypothetical protein